MKTNENTNLETTSTQKAIVNSWLTLLKVIIENNDNIKDDKKYQIFVKDIQAVLDNQPLSVSKYLKEAIYDPMSILGIGIIVVLSLDKIDLFIDNSAALITFLFLQSLIMAFYSLINAEYKWLNSNGFSNIDKISKEKLTVFIQQEQKQLYPFIPNTWFFNNGGDVLNIDEYSVARVFWSLIFDEQEKIKDKLYKKIYSLLQKTLNIQDEQYVLHQINQCIDSVQKMNYFINLGLEIDKAQEIVNKNHQKVLSQYDELVKNRELQQKALGITKQLKCLDRHNNLVNDGLIFSLLVGVNDNNKLNKLSYELEKLIKVHQATPEIDMNLFDLLDYSRPHKFYNALLVEIEFKTEATQKAMIEQIMGNVARINEQKALTPMNHY